MPSKRLFVRRPSACTRRRRRSPLVERAAKGEEIVISKSGRPKARLLPLDDVRPIRRPGRGRGAWKIGRDFDAPLPEDICSAFGHDDA